MSVILLSTLGGSSSAQVIIVVNEKNPTKDISKKDLQKIFLGKKTQFEDGERILLGEYKQAKTDFYRFVYNWPVRKIKKYWMKEIFSGSSVAPPVNFEEIDEVVEFLKKNRAAICYINRDDIVKGIKTLTIDGISYDSPDYPLK